MCLFFLNRAVFSPQGIPFMCQWLNWQLVKWNDKIEHFSNSVLFADWSTVLSYWRPQRHYTPWPIIKYCNQTICTSIIYIGAILGRSDFENWFYKLYTLCLSALGKLSTRILHCLCEYIVAILSILIHSYHVFCISLNKNKVEYNQFTETCNSW